VPLVAPAPRTYLDTAPLAWKERGAGRLSAGARRATADGGLSRRRIHRRWRRPRRRSPTRPPCWRSSPCRTWTTNRRTEIVSTSSRLCDASLTLCRAACQPRPARPLPRLISDCGRSRGITMKWEVPGATPPVGDARTGAYHPTRGREADTDCRGWRRRAGSRAAGWQHRHPKLARLPRQPI
jgi:hypothetical protein